MSPWNQSTASGDATQCEIGDGTRGAVLKQLVAAGGNATQLGNGDEGLQLGPGRDVHATLRNPSGLEVVGGAGVKVGDERGNEGLA